MHCGWVMPGQTFGRLISLSGRIKGGTGDWAIRQLTSFLSIV
jgi:hypothetical protein